MTSMDFKQSLSSSLAGGEFSSSPNFCAAAPVASHHTSNLVPVGSRSRSRNRPDVPGLHGQSYEQHEQPYSFMSAPPVSRGPTTRWQSCQDEGYGCRQDLAKLTATSRPTERHPQSDSGGVRNGSRDQEEENDEDADENDDDGFAWDSSLHEPKVLRRSVDAWGIERRDPSLSPSGSASLTSAKSRNTTDGPIPPSSSLPSTPDSKLNAGLEEAISTFQSWEVDHNVSFSGRSSQHQRCTSALSVSLHSTTSRVSDGFTLQSDFLHDEPPPLPTNLHFLQPPNRISQSNGSSIPCSRHNTEQVKLDLLEEQEKELVELAIERSKQDTLPKDQFEPSLRVALAESMRTQFLSHRSCPDATLSVSFSLSEPPPPTPSFNDMFSLPEPSRPIPSTVSDVHQSEQSHSQPGQRLSGNFLSESPPPIPSCSCADREMSTTVSSFQGTVSTPPSHNCNLMGPEDFSTSEVEEQRMLRMALERSLHEPTSPRRPQSRTSSSPRYRNSRHTGD